MWSEFSFSLADHSSCWTCRDKRTDGSFSPAARYACTRPLRPARPVGVSNLANVTGSASGLRVLNSRPLSRKLNALATKPPSHQLISNEFVCFNFIEIIRYKQLISLKITFIHYKRDQVFCANKLPFLVLHLFFRYVLSGRLGSAFIFPFYIFHF